MRCWESSRSLTVSNLVPLSASVLNSSRNHPAPNTLALIPCCTHSELISAWSDLAQSNTKVNTEAICWPSWRCNFEMAGRELHKKGIWNDFTVIPLRLIRECILENIKWEEGEFEFKLWVLDGLLFLLFLDYSIW